MADLMLKLEATTDAQAAKVDCFAGTHIADALMRLADHLGVSIDVQCERGAQVTVGKTGDRNG